MRAKKRIKQEKEGESSKTGAITEFSHQRTKRHSQEGALQLKLGDYAAARQEFSSEIKKNPKNGEAYFHLGYCQCMLGDAKSGRESFNRAIELGAHVPKAHFNIGLSFFLEREYLKAVDEFSRAINRGPSSSSSAFFFRCLAYVELAWPYSTNYLHSEKKKDPSDIHFSNFYGRMAYADLLHLLSIREKLPKEMQEKLFSLSDLVSFSIAGSDSKKAEKAREAESKRIQGL